MSYIDARYHGVLTRVVRTVALLIIAVVLSLAAVSSSETEPIPEVYNLTGPSSSFLMTNQCPASDVLLYFYINVEQPGLIFDTVGINAAQPGDWTLRISTDGVLSFAVFKPDVSTAFSDGTGWHRYALNEPLGFNHDYYIHLEIENLMFMMLTADESGSQAYVYEQVPTALRSAQVFVGDFKGDEHWGSGYNIHRAATALVMPFYFGPYTDDPTASAGQSWVIPGSGIDLGLDEHDAGTDSGGLTPSDNDGQLPTDSGGQITPDGGDQSPADDPPVILPSGSYPPAESPEEAVKAFLQAQVDEDIDRALAYVAMDMFTEENQAVARDVFELFAERTQSSDLRYKTLATAYSHEKDYAIVRCAHSMTVQAGADTVTQPCGSLVLVRSSSDGWQVVQFIIDDLLNVELEVQRLRADSSLTGLILASAQQVPQAIDGRLLELSDLSELMSAKLNEVYFDKTKLVTDHGMALTSYIPVIGPAISAGYTGYQTIKTAITEVLPDLMKGDWEMVGIGTAQLTIGGVQIAAYVTSSATGGLATPAGVMLSSAGNAVDNYKASVRQARNQSILRVSVKRADVNTPKYLFLHEQPIHTDPDFGIKTNGRDNITFEFHDDRRFRPGPLKKIIFKSDIPICKWKTLDFDIGYYFRIKESVSQVLFDAATAQGYPTHSISGTSPDFEVYIPVRLESSGLWQSLGFGDWFSDHEFENNPTKASMLKVQSEGTAILTNGLVVGDIRQQRYLQFDITTTPGKNQTLQVRLASPDYPLTEPVEIVNEIYNAVEELTPESNLELLEQEERQQLEVPMLADHQVTFRGYTPGRPHPRMIGAPNVDWYIDRKDIVEATLVGEFPSAAIMFHGLKPGNTVLRYQIPIATGQPDNPTMPQVRKGEISIEVVSADWVLVDVEIVPENPEYKGEGSFADGTAYAKKELHYHGRWAVQEGTASWSSPPAAIPDTGGVWHIQGFISHSAQTLEGIDDQTMRQYTSAIALTDQHRNPNFRPGKIKKWSANMDTERVRIDEELDLDVFCIREWDRIDGVNKYTGRRIIYMECWFPGRDAEIRYIYKRPGTY